MDNILLTGNTMVGRCDDGTEPWERDNPFEAAMKEEFVDCDFCGEAVKLGGCCPSCSRTCDPDNYFKGQVI